MRELDIVLAGHPADLAIVISPHSPSSMTSLPVRHAAHVAGDLARFRAPQVRVEAIVDTALVTALVGDAQRAGFALTWAEESDLDHGVVVPLYSLPQAMANKRCVFLGVSGWPLARFFAFGAWLHQRLLGRSAILLASGDLSHRLTPDAPYGFRPEGPVFDRLVIDALRDREWERIEGMDPELIEEAGECGLRPLAILLGAARAAGLSSKVLSYEGPFGVGYPVVAFTPAAGGFDIQDFGRRAIKVQLLEPAEAVTDIATLDPGLYGIIVRCGDRRALLLPGIDEIVTPEQQLRAACEKAGIDRFAPLQVERFRARTIE